MFYYIILALNQVLRVLEIMKKNSLNYYRQTKDSHYETQINNKETSINELLYNFKISKTNLTVYDGISDFLNYVKSQGFKMKIYK